LASGISGVLLARDFSHLYGYQDYASHFHAIPNARLPEREEFWVRQLETMDIVQDFQLLSDSRYAVIQGVFGNRGPDITVLERVGQRTRIVSKLCQTRSPVSRIIPGPNSFLFLPQKKVGNKLVVALHGDPFEFTGREGSWLIDALLAEGTPVLAVNYFGSPDRSLEMKPDQDQAETYGADVGGAVAFARAALGSNPKTVFVVDGFGALVGFSAILSQRAAPDGVLVLSGLMSGSAAFEEFGTTNGSPYETYMRRVERQFDRVVDAGKIVDAKPDIRVVLVHGRTDYRRPPEDVQEFAARFNASRPKVPATVVVIDDIVDDRPGHATRKEYETELDTIHTFLSQF